ncbi:MAG: acyl-ACP thioesterase domain-containing protein [Candidatus Limnocylindrales bacterium]
MTERASIVAGVTIPYRIRFDECGPDGIVRTSALLRYAQDVAWIHSELLGFDRAWYGERGLAWVVRAAELGILAPASLGATLSISTAIIGFRKVWARRRTEARLPDGTLAMWGHTDWVMTDHRGMPGRVPREFPAAFEVIPPSFEPGRVPLPSTPADASLLATRVRPQDLDPMAHVNNAAYLDYLEEALLGAGAGPAFLGTTPRTVRLEYLQPAAPNAMLTGAAWRLDDGEASGWAWRLTDGGAGGRELARGRILAR